MNDEVTPAGAGSEGPTRLAARLGQMAALQPPAPGPSTPTPDLSALLQRLRRRHEAHRTLKINEFVAHH